MGIYIFPCCLISESLYNLSTASTKLMLQNTFLLLTLVTSSCNLVPLGYQRWKYNLISSFQVINIIFLFLRQV